MLGTLNCTASTGLPSGLSTLCRSHPWKDHTALWPLSSCRIFWKENSNHHFYCQTKSSHENLRLHSSDKGRWCICCCWVGAACRLLLLLVGWVFLWHRDRDSMTLSWRPGCKWNIAQHSHVPTEGDCEVLHNGLLTPVILLWIIQRTANCILPSLSHTSHPFI